MGFSLTIETGTLDGVPRLENLAEWVTDRKETEAAGTASAVRLDACLLLAEDSPDNQWLFVTLLKSAGADVMAVENGKRQNTVVLCSCGQLNQARPLDSLPRRGG